MTSLFDKVNKLVPEELTERDDIITFLLSNGLYIHDDDEHLPFNSLCNHMEGVIMRGGQELAGHGTHFGWYKQAARTKLFGLLAQCRGIQNGFEFKISTKEDQ